MSAESGHPSEVIAALLGADGGRVASELVLAQ